jgi:hypothetical protein
VVLTQFPEYLAYWDENGGAERTRSVLQEQVFHLPYPLPSGRTVHLRGKQDGAHIVGRADVDLYLFETKTKSQIDQEKITRQLTFDLQTMLYLVVLSHPATRPLLNEKIGHKRWKVCGVRYNVIRRSLPIRQKKPSRTNPNGETSEQFFARFRDDYLRAEPAEWFYRWKAPVAPADLKKFERECLVPLLEQLCDWYSWVTAGDPWRDGNRLHWRHPYGLRHILDEGGSTDYDEYLYTGSEMGLHRVESLFGEL